MEKHELKNDLLNSGPEATGKKAEKIAKIHRVTSITCAIVAIFCAGYCSYETKQLNAFKFNNEGLHDKIAAQQATIDSLTHENAKISSKSNN